MNFEKLSVVIDGKEVDLSDHIDDCKTSGGEFGLGDLLDAIKYHIEGEADEGFPNVVVHVYPEHD